MDVRFGPISTDLNICRGCGRSYRSIMGHNETDYCYGCGALGSIEKAKDDSEFGRLFGSGGWFSTQFPSIEVEWPGDLNFDPWTGVRLAAPVVGPKMLDWQLGLVREFVC